MLRVIAGKAKGRLLTAPKGVRTRPVTAQIKESLFNIWQTKITGADFLDLFAGSGSMGIEAMSRGAKNVVFVEKDRRAVSIIRKNLALCDFKDGFEVFQDDVARRLKWLKEKGRLFDIIYLDPPFTADGIFLPVMELLADMDILNSGGSAAIRTKRESSMPDTIGQLEKFKLKTYGISNIHFYQ